MKNARLLDCSALPLEELDFQLSPSKTAKDANASLAALVTATDDARNSQNMRVTVDVSYGVRSRQNLDVFEPILAESNLRPCLIFIHGGFWQEGSKDVSGFAAEALALQGCVSVSIGYTLTPEVSLTELTQEVSDGVMFVHRNAEAYGIDPNRIILSGHSAGGHLTASILADLIGTGADTLISGVILVSGVFDLGPIAKSYVNDLARISEAEIQSLSPIKHAPKRDIPVHLVIGADEPEAFQAQSDALVEAWRSKLTNLTLSRVAGRDHFDILNELANPKSVAFEMLQHMIKKA